MTNTTDDLVSLAARLREYNDWRREGDGDQPSPKIVGEDIDSAIAAIESLINYKKRGDRERN